jgi:hypothetical protein
MPLTIRVMVTPDVGSFQPDSFQELLQRHIVLPGLDPLWTHTLTAVDVAPSGTAAQLTLASTPPGVPQLVGGLRIVHGSPEACVRVFDQAGEQLAETRFPAPLQPGQEIAVGNVHYRVESESWPGRNPDTGVCSGDLDWQHVVVGSPLPAITSEPSPA